MGRFSEKTGQRMLNELFEESQFFVLFRAIDRYPLSECNKAVWLSSFVASSSPADALHKLIRQR